MFLIIEYIRKNSNFWNEHPKFTKRKEKEMF